MGWFGAKNKVAADGGAAISDAEPLAEGAARFRLCKLISLASAVILLVVGIVVFDFEETVDTFRYLVKNLSGSEIVYGEMSAPIAFDADSAVRCDSFRKDVAVVQKNGAALYDTKGKLQYKDTFSFSSPQLLVADDVFLVYDLGGKTLKVYNAFSNIFTLESDYPIFAVSLHADGTFAVATSEQGYHAAVLVYNPSFQCVFKWRSPDKLVMDVAVCPYDDSKIAIAACKADEGDFSSEIILLSTRSEKIVSSVTLPDALAMMAVFSNESAKGFSVLTDSSLVTLSEKGETLANNTFTSTDLSAYCLGEDYCVLAQKKSMVGSTYTLKIISPAGEILQETDIHSQIFDIVADHDAVYVLAYETLYIFYPEEKGMRTYEVSRSFREILPFGDNTLGFVSDHTVCFMLLE